MRHGTELAAKAATHVVDEVEGGFVVRSKSGNAYTVVPNGRRGYTCNCRWGQPYGRQAKSRRFSSGCSHALAVEFYVAEQTGCVAEVVVGAGVSASGMLDLGQGLMVAVREAA